MSEETEKSAEQEAGAAADSTKAESADKGADDGTGARGLVNPLSRATDYTVRPGFRNPSNTRSKASRKKKKRRR